MRTPRSRPTSRQLLVAFLCLVLASTAAFVGASLTQERPIFSLSPPGAPDAPDVPASKRLDLHRTFFTAWAAVLLVTPALCTFLFVRTSQRAAGWWLAFWTASLLAFLVHFYWAVVVIFDNDWTRIFHTTRVSAALPDLVFVVWWALDVLLAWVIWRDGLAIRIERALVHALAFILFFAGSALQGEIFWSRAVGYTLGIAMLLSIIARIARGIGSRRAAAA
jgi:magnesium-transporting ATPase (P-type)